MQMNHQDGQPGGSSALGGDASLANSLSGGELELGVTRSSSTAQSGAARSPPHVRASTTTTVDIIIDRVRAGARNVDPHEYDPHHVSIGPYHHRRPQGTHLWKEHDKQVGLDVVLSAATPDRVAVEAICIGELARLENRARGCYGEEIDMVSEEFVRMLLLDACYILACFGRIYPDAGLMADRLAVVRDVFYLAENQIPFFVLEKIAELTSNLETSDGDAPAVLDDIKRYALALLERRRYSMAEPVPTALGNLLHLLRMHLNPTELPSSPPTGGGEKVTRWRTATDYYLAGVKIKGQAISASGNVRCILDVKLGCGTLTIPCLDIDGQTWRLLRNLMALEQHSRGTVASHVTAYCVFMSQLACETRDVELLFRRRVIVHSHGYDGDVAGCFRELCLGIEFSPDDPDANYLRTTWQEVEKWRRCRCRRWLAWLRRKYFSNPWVMLGLIAATIGLTCTVIQAAYSILSYKKQGRN